MWLLYKKWSLCMFMGWLLSYIQFIDWFSTCFDLYVFSFLLNYCSKYVIGCFYKKWLLCMIVEWVLSYIQFIDWFSTYILICMLFLYIWIIVAGMSVAVFTIIKYSVWLLNYHYLISSSMIDSLLAYIGMLFLFIWIIVASMFVAVFTRSDCFVWL